MSAEEHRINCDGEEWIVETSKVGFSASPAGFDPQANRMLVKFKRGSETHVMYKGGDFQLDKVTDEYLCRQLASARKTEGPPTTEGPST